jgi:chemotaxis-related protein WspD
MSKTTVTEDNKIPEKTADIELDDCWNKVGVWGNKTTRCPKLKDVIHCRNCEIYSIAGRTVLERKIPDKYEEKWAAVYSKSKKEKISGTESITIFRLGSEWMALPTKIIEEITDVKEVHSLPHQRSSILKGLMNLRGQMSICVSLGQLLEIEKYQNKNQDVRNRTYERIIAINHNNSSFVFLVSEVKSTYRLHPNELKEPHSMLALAKGTFTKGILSWQGQDVAYLDAELLFYSLDKKLA